MKLYRIRAVLLQQLYLTYHSLEAIFDVFIFSFINLLLFGFLSRYLAGSEKSIVSQELMLGMLLWELVRIVQYAISVGTMWNVWSRNLSNMFVTPLKVTEYFSALISTGIILAIVVVTFDAIITKLVFNFSLFDLGWMLILYGIFLMTFSISAGIMIMGLIFRFGTKIQAFTWGIIPVLQPITAALFPVSVLPPSLQAIAYLFPGTYVFEAARYQLETTLIDWNGLMYAAGIDIIFMILSIVLFIWLYNRSRDSGQFARNES